MSSHQTVSRVLGDHPNVRDETRARVLRAIEEMGYRRNSSARALATRRTLTLGVVASNTTLYGPASTLFALEEAARAEGYLVSTVSLRELTVETLSEALDRLSEGGVEGVIALAPQRSAVEALDRTPPALPGGGRGHGHPAWRSPASTWTSNWARGWPPAICWPRATARSGISPGPRTGRRRRTGPSAGGRPSKRRASNRRTPLRGDWSPLSGYRAGQELAGWVGRGLTAVFVANDQMALGVLRALREAGVRTPQDVAVVGFDDIPESEFFAPPLTTVRQDFSTVGKRSIALLLDLDRGPDPSGTSRIAIEPQLVVRASTFPYAPQPGALPADAAPTRSPFAPSARPRFRTMIDRLDVSAAGPPRVPTSTSGSIPGRLFKGEDTCSTEGTSSLRRSAWRLRRGLAACAKEDEGSSTSGSGGGGGKKITLGFSQVGSESGWRSANTDSVKAAAKEAGYTLKFSDAQQKQENQISAIRSYITQGVDVIAFSPVVVTGWDAVLKEAKAKKIPVVLTDRSVETSDESLFVTLVGSDFTDEGRRAGQDPGEGPGEGRPQGRREDRPAGGHHRCRPRDRARQGLQGGHGRRPRGRLEDRRQPDR